MDYLDYKLLQYELIPTIGDLNAFIRSNGDAQIAVSGLSGNRKKELINGFDAALGKYAKVLEEFTDRFDFPDGFYKTEVYVPDDNGIPASN